MNAWLLALCLLVIHIGFTNALEKLLVQQWFGSMRRPCTSCRDQDAFACLGMPSGHAESIVILTSILLWKGIISLPLAIVIVLLVSLQRIFAHRHTIQQVLTGAFLGFIYVCLYYSLQKDNHILIVSILIPITMLLVITSLINQRTYEPLPAWIDPNLHDIIFKKQQSHFINKVFHVLTVIFIHSYTLFCSWDHLENHLDEVVKAMKTQEIDAIVGIKSGGAIISKYVAEKLDVPYYYIKISGNKWKCNKKAIHTYQDIFQRVVMNNHHEYIICEPIEANLKNKTVLLLDELVSSGTSMKTVQDYLYQDKQAKRVILATITTHQPPKSYVEKGMNITYVTNNKYVVWPWGFDN